MKNLFFLKNHFIFVIEIDNQIVATGTLFIEPKLIHDVSKIGHIEDIIVSKEYRKMGLGKKMINYLVNLAKQQKCYKVILNCTNNYISFYEKCSFKLTNNQMSIYF
jgi:glucosamine-phosphate N-acetyltransferase